MEAWQAELERGRNDAAWDRFIERYRRLIFATIRRFLSDSDDVMDAFTRVCEAMRADDLRRLRIYIAEPAHRARFSTWLVVVVRNLVVDWVRSHKGRPRQPVAASRLTPLQQRIHELVFLQHCGHAEAYEVIRSAHHSELRFGAYLRELRAVYAAMARSGHELPEGPTIETVVGMNAQQGDAAALEEARAALEDALGRLSARERAAVQLYVVDGLPAGEIAELLGLPSAKAVYNRVYRALADLRVHLRAAGYGPGSL